MRKPLSYCVECRSSFIKIKTVTNWNIDKLCAECHNDFINQVLTFVDRVESDRLWVAINDFNTIITLYYRADCNGRRYIDDLKPGQQIKRMYKELVEIRNCIYDGTIKEKVDEVIAPVIKNVVHQKPENGILIGTCKYCNEQFDMLRHGQQYCSDEHRLLQYRVDYKIANGDTSPVVNVKMKQPKSEKRIMKGTCKYCDEQFNKSRHGQQYCSDEHRLLQYKIDYKNTYQSVRIHQTG